MSDAASYGATRTPDTLLGPQPHRTAVLEPPGIPGDPVPAVDPMVGDLPPTPDAARTRPGSPSAWTR